MMKKIRTDQSTLINPQSHKQRSIKDEPSLNGQSKTYWVLKLALFAGNHTPNSDAAQNYKYMFVQHSDS